MGKMAGFAAGAAGIGALVVTLKTGIDEFMEASKVGAQTNAVLKSTGAAANVTSKHVSELAGALMKKSGVDDEAIQSGENLLLTFTNIRNEVGKGNDIFDRSTKIMLDMSVALGQDMKSSAIQLGKALNDPIKGLTALQRVGVAFTADQKEQIKALVESGHAMDAQKVILRELTKEFGGSAEAAGKTLPGQLNILKETFSNVAGEAVSALIPAIKQIVDWLSAALPHIENFVRGLINGIKPVVTAVVDYIKANWPAIEAAFSATVTFVRQSLLPILETLGRAFINMASNAWRVIQGAMPLIKGALEGVLAVARLLASFLATDFGGKLAVAVIAVIGVVAAVHRLSGAFTSLMAFKFNPWVAGITILLAGLSAAFLNNKEKVNADAAAYLNLRDSAKRLRDNVFDLKQSQIDQTRATQAAKDADNQADAAKRKYTNAVQEHGRNSKEAKSALENYRQATLNAKQADLDLLQTQARLANASKTVRDSFAGANDKLREMVGASRNAEERLRGFNPIMEVSGTKAREAKAEYGGFLTATEKLAGKFSALARELQDVNPKASENARQIARQAQAAHNLALKMGEIPDFETVKAEARIHFSVATSRQEGGFIPMMPGGKRGIDSVLSYLAPGELVLNEKQQAELGGSKALADMFGFNLPAGLAGGGFVGSAGKSNRALKSGFIVLAGDESNWPVPPALIGIKRVANEIDSHHYHYAVGGGNAGTGPSYGAASWSGGPTVLGFDCSGAINTVLHSGAGFPTGGFVSANYLSWGAPGAGAHMNLYAKPGSGGAGHVYSDIDGVGFGTSSENPGGGAGWFSGGWRPGYSIRHPYGLAGGGFVPNQARLLAGQSSLIRALGAAMLSAGIDQGIMPGLGAGTSFAPGGWSMVGEHGPELMFVPRGARVVSNAILRRMQEGGFVGTGGTNFKQVTYDAIFNNPDAPVLDSVLRSLGYDRMVGGAIVAPFSLPENFRGAWIVANPPAGVIDRRGTAGTGGLAPPTGRTPWPPQGRTPWPPQGRAPWEGEPIGRTPMPPGLWQIGKAGGGDLGGMGGGSPINIYVTVTGNIATEDQFARSLAPKIRGELTRIGARNLNTLGV